VQTPTKSRIRITTEVERIVAKIWSTASDIVNPNQQFGDASGRTNPPHAKAAIAHLRSLSMLTPPPNSPSASSLSSRTSGLLNEPTFQQILTAHLLLALLASSNHCLPMNTVKDLLTSKASEGGTTTSTSPIRILYACVGKRLLKIERGGGEQIIRFDL